MRAQLHSPIAERSVSRQQSIESGGFGDLWEMLVFAALLPTQTASATIPALPSPAEAKRAIVSCGLPDQQVSVQYERDMQEDVVWIVARPALPESKLAFIAKASLSTSYYVYFRDETQQPSYEKIYDKFSYEMETTRAQAWLRQRNRLSSMPLPQKGKPLADYTKAVEAFCGVTPGALLLARDEHFITFAEGGLGRVTEKGIEGAAATNEQFECVTNTLSAANLRSRGLFFGIIGNEAVKSAN